MKPYRITITLERDVMADSEEDAKCIAEDIYLNITDCKAELIEPEFEKE